MKKKCLLMQNPAGSTLQSRNSACLCPSAVPDVNKALIAQAGMLLAAPNAPERNWVKVPEKIRKKWSEACLKQLLQQMSQFSCFAESRFMEARSAKLEWQCVGVGAPRIPVPGHGISSAPHECPWAPFPQRAGMFSCLPHSRCWEVITA